MGLIAVGLLLEARGLLARRISLERTGSVLVLVGALLYALFVSPSSTGEQAECLGA